MATLIIASDHAGFGLKSTLSLYLKSKEFDLVDLGCNSSEESVDYPDYAHRLALKVLETGSPGILICGTGIGMSIAANRHSGVRAALCHSEEYAKLSREHNDSNILCLGARFLTEPEALGITDIWLSTDFLAGRHSIRVEKL